VASASLGWCGRMEFLNRLLIRTCRCVSE